MLHFNDLKYYAVPSLPNSWTAPSWLKIELGIIAGRLYFEYEEYTDLCNFLGVREADGKLAETDVEDLLSSAEQSAEQSDAEELDDEVNDEVAKDAKMQPMQSFTKKPLTFLHEWLAVRRKGQDFAHTPMGYVCQGKQLTANHPFFARVETTSTLNAEPLGGRARERTATVAADDVDADITEDEEGFDEDVYYVDGEDDAGGVM
jgi:hypothetical protein